MGERTPLALLDPAASGRMAVAEALTNIAAADVRRIEDMRLSANWMAACGEPGEDADLHDTVHAVGGAVLPGARHRDTGRQGFAFDAYGVARGRRRAPGARARIVDRLSIRAGRRRAPHADAAAETRSGRDSAAARRSRTRPQPAGWIVPRAGVRPHRRRDRGLRRCRVAARVLCRDPGARRRRSPARLSRPVRRRNIRDARGDGFRGSTAASR